MRLLFPSVGRNTFRSQNICCIFINFIWKLNLWIEEEFHSGRLAYKLITTSSDKVLRNMLLGPFAVCQSRRTKVRWNMQPHQMNCRRGDLISRFDKPHDDFTKHLNFHDICVCVFAQCVVKSDDNLDLSIQIYDCRS